MLVWIIHACLEGCFILFFGKLLDACLEGSMCWRSKRLLAYLPTVLILHKNTFLCVSQSNNSSINTRSAATYED